MSARPNRYDASDRDDATKEMAALKAQAKAERDARIVKAHLANPDMGMDLLGERFGMSGHAVSPILVAAGVRQTKPKAKKKH